MFGHVPTILQWAHHRLAQFYPSTILVDILIGFVETKPLPVHNLTAMYFTAILNCSQGLHTANGSLHDMAYYMQVVKIWQWGPCS